MTRRTVIKLLFLLVLVAQPAQWFFIARHGEPYPAITMPSFAGAGPRDGEPMTSEGVTVTAHFADGGAADVPPRQLLAQCPISHYQAILSDNFGPLQWHEPAAPAAAPDPAAPAKPVGLKARVKTLFLPGYAAAMRRRSDRSAAYAQIPWLRARLVQLFPGRRPVAITFAWYTDTFRFGDGGSGGGRPFEQRREPECERTLNLTSDRR